MKNIKNMIPNAITSTGILLGMFAISLVFRGQYTEAAWLLLLCTVLDKLDGTAARHLNATSQMGIQLDSLSDLITFIVAPAILWMAVLTGAEGPFEQGSFYQLITLLSLGLYVVAGALRLAKFNTLATETPSDFFSGVPTTMGGAHLVSLYLALTVSLDVQVATYAMFVPPLFAIIGILMVSSFLYPKFKMRRSRLINIFQQANFAVSVVFIVVRVAPAYLFLMGAIYTVFGMVWANLLSKPAEQVQD